MLDFEAIDRGSSAEEDGEGEGEEGNKEGDKQPTRRRTAYEVERDATLARNDENMRRLFPELERPKAPTNISAVQVEAPVPLPSDHAQPRRSPRIATPKPEP